MDTISRLAVTFLLNAVWQSTLIGGAAWAGARLLRNVPAKRRHVLYVFALLLCVATPLASVFRDPGKTFRGRFPRTAISVSQITRSSELNAPSTTNPLNNAHKATPERILPLNATWVLVLAGLYFIFLAYRLMRFVTALREVRRIRKGGYERDLPVWMASEVARCARAIGIREPVILCAPSLLCPITIGVWQPAILIPATFWLGDSAADLRAVLLHEMAHIRRLDFSKNILYEIVLVPVSFHPTAIVVKRAIDETREIACDELATRQIIRPAEYAKSLVNIARAIPEGAARDDGYSLGIFDANILEVRIMKLLHANYVSRRLAQIYFAAGFFLLLSACVAASSFPLRVGGRDSTAAVRQATSQTAAVKSGNAESEQQKGVFAVNTVRLINTAEYKYKFAHGGKVGPFADFATLVSSGMLDSEGHSPMFRRVIDKLNLKSTTEPVPGFAMSLIVSPDKQSYSLSIKEKGEHADPIEFFSDQSGVISQGRPLR